MAKVKVVLTKPVANLGEAGDVATVAGGYARNYLIPRGLAVAGTKGNVRGADVWKRSKAARAGRELRAAEELKVKLEQAVLQIKAQAGPDGRLFGSVTAPQVSAAAKKTLALEVDRHDIQIPDSIRHLGFHEVRIKLHADVSAGVTIEVVEDE